MAMTDYLNLAIDTIVDFNTLWYGKVLTITLISFVVWIIWRLVYRQLYALLSKTKMRWDDELLDALQTPISFVVWGWPATLSMGIILKHFYTNSTIDWLANLKQGFFIVVAAWIVIRLIANIEENTLKKKKRDETTVQALGKIARLICLAIGGITLLQTFGISVAGLLTFGGVGGLVVGLAAKDLLSNFFGGIVIYFDRPFKVGDWIRSPDRQIEGTVERIGLRMTVIRTFDLRPIYVPNSVFTSVVVENPSRMFNRRINETIGVRYQDISSVDAIVADVKSMLENHQEIDTTKTLMVHFNSFGPSSLDFFIYTFTKTVNWNRYHEVKHDVLIKIADIIERHQAQIAYPSRSLYLENSEALTALSSQNTAHLAPNTPSPTSNN